MADLVSYFQPEGHAKRNIVVTAWQVKLHNAEMILAVAAAIALLATLALTIGDALMAFPLGDELLRSSIPRVPSVLGLVEYDYMNFCGRWAAMLTHYLIEHDRRILADYSTYLLLAWARKKLPCSGHATNSRRYRDLGSAGLFAPSQ
jgi:hypothetical protein